MNDHEVTATLAAEAGSLLVEIRSGGGAEGDRRANELLGSLDAVLVPMGSAGAKAMAVIRGDVDVYAHSAGQHEGDSCAPVAVSKAAGLHASRLDGSPLRYNTPDPYLPDLLVCRPELVDAVHEALGADPSSNARGRPT